MACWDQNQVAAGGDIPPLLEIDDRVGRGPELSGGRCPFSFRLRRERIGHIKISLYLHLRAASPR
jgi:hypothetical protein